jgi:ribosomal protein S12 methylthiotransferase accessory factor
VLDVTNDLDSSFVAIMHWMHNSQENIEFGSGSHFNTRIALLRAMTEPANFCPLASWRWDREKSSLDKSTPLRLRIIPFDAERQTGDGPCSKVGCLSRASRLPAFVYAKGL